MSCHVSPISCRQDIGADFSSLQVVKYTSCNFHSYEFVAKLLIFPMKNVILRTFLIFIILYEERLTSLLTSVMYYHLVAKIQFSSQMAKRLGHKT